jgi:hypothetical protein
VVCTTQNTANSAMSTTSAQSTGVVDRVARLIATVAVREASIATEMVRYMPT